MKTWEVIKELTENPNKRFKLKGENNSIYVSDREIKGGIDLIDVDYISINDEWEEEVKIPVIFMTAIESGQRIKVEHELLEDTYVDDLLDFSSVDVLLCALAQHFGSNDLVDIIVNGEWYIE